MAPRLRWPNHAENKRQQAQDLADEAADLIRRGSALLDSRDPVEVQRGRTLLAEAKALNERIGRLMAEARHP